MSRSELVERSGISKQQLSRLENGQIRLRLDHLKPFAPLLGYSPEQILLWGRFPGADLSNLTPIDVSREDAAQLRDRVPELDTRAKAGVGKLRTRQLRKEGSVADPLKSEGWLFPASFVREQLHTSPERLLVLDTNSDSMAPTVMSGERVVVDTGHRTPTPDGLYAIRDAFGSIIVKRLQVLRSARPTRLKVISDNSNHPSEEASLDELEIVGRVLCCIKLL